jgi:hypothetical protein
MLVRFEKAQPAVSRLRSAWFSGGSWMIASNTAEGVVIRVRDDRRLRHRMTLVYQSTSWSNGTRPAGRCSGPADTAAEARPVQLACNSTAIG